MGANTHIKPSVSILTMLQEPMAQAIAIPECKLEFRAEDDA